MSNPENLPTRMTWPMSHVCLALGISEATFKAKRRDLEAAGFPRKLPGLNAWSIAAVKDWIRTSAGEYVGAARLAIANDDPEIEEAVSELEKAYVSDQPLQQVA